MHSSESELADLFSAFRPLFTRPTYARALTLVEGAILSLGCRTVAAALRVTGLQDHPRFERYHRVLSRASWSALQASRILLLLLVVAFAPTGMLFFIVDDMVERRWGPQINPRGIYRDPVRSSRGHFVKTSGLRWVCIMLVVQVPWSGRMWALPVLTVLAPSERYCAERGRRHKTIVRWARQMILQLCRWLPGRQITVLTDVGYAGQQLLDAVCPRVTVVGQMRLNSALYDFPPPRAPGKRGPERKKGDRQPSLEERLLDPKTEWTRVRGSFWYGDREVELDIATGLAVWYSPGRPAVRIRWVLVRDPNGKRDPRAFFSTDLSMEALEILRHYIRRWSVEVTFEEARRHLGIETQRQWSDLAIARTTPCLLGVFSLTALLADRLQARGLLRVRRAAWYEKPMPTFSDALAAARRHLWEARNTSGSRSDGEDEEFLDPLFRCLIETLAYAA
jgi:DDE superfamily endonuclease